MKTKIMTVLLSAALVISMAACASIPKDPEKLNDAGDSAHFKTIMAENEAKLKLSPSPETKPAAATATPVKTATPVVTPLKAVKTKKAKYTDDYRFYPEHLGNTWYFMGYKKNKPDRILKVKAEFLSEEIKDDQLYYYIHAPQMGIRYVNKLKEKAVFMRVIKYPFPIFGFPVEVDIAPEMPVMKFPFRTGERWTAKAKARATVFFIPIERDIQSDFEIVGKETVKVPAGEIEAWHIKVLVNQGDDTITTEEYWYGKDFGYCKANTTGHYAELVGYRIWDEIKGEWKEKIPEGVEQYE